MTRSALLVFTLFAALPAQAAEWGLKWNAPTGCIDAATLARAVESRLGRGVFTLSPSHRIDGLAEPSATGGFRVRLTVVDTAGNVGGSRELSTIKADCRALDEELVLVVAVMIEPKVGPSGESVTPPKLPLAPSPGSEAPQGVRLHIDAGNTKVRLVRRTGEIAGYVAFADECVSPCDRAISKPDSRFRIEGDDLVPSTEFTLIEHHPAVEVRVRPGDQHLRFAGVLLMSLGGVSTFFGGVFTGVSLGVGNGSGALGGMLLAGAITLGIGLVSLAIGVPLFRANATELEFVNPSRSPIDTSASASR